MVYTVVKVFSDPIRKKKINSLANKTVNCSILTYFVLSSILVLNIYRRYFQKKAFIKVEATLYNKPIEVHYNAYNSLALTVP